MFLKENAFDFMIPDVFTGDTEMVHRYKSEQIGFCFVSVHPPVEAEHLCVQSEYLLISVFPF